MLYSCTRMATLAVKGLKAKSTFQAESIAACEALDGASSYGVKLSLIQFVFTMSEHVFNAQNNSP